jgi:hypothetical protein
MPGVDLVVVCAPAADGVQVAPCPLIGSVGYAPTVVERPALDAAQVEAWNLPIDFAQVGEMALLPLGVILGAFLTAYAVGVVVKSVADL